LFYFRSWDLQRELDDEVLNMLLDTGIKSLKRDGDIGEGLNPNRSLFVTSINISQGKGIKAEGI